MTILYFYLFMVIFLGVVLYLTKHDMIDDKGVAIVLWTVVFGVVLFSLSAVRDQINIEQNHKLQHVENPC
jgi:hypothetical protein